MPFVRHQGLPARYHVISPYPVFLNLFFMQRSIPHTTVMTRLSPKTEFKTAEVACSGGEKQHTPFETKRYSVCLSPKTSCQASITQIAAPLLRTHIKSSFTLVIHIHEMPRPHTTFSTRSTTLTLHRTNSRALYSWQVLQQ